MLLERFLEAFPTDFCLFWGAPAPEKPLKFIVLSAEIKVWPKRVATAIPAAFGLLVAPFWDHFWRLLETSGGFEASKKRA